MVQAGRVACTFTPFVLTLGALICLVLIFLSGTIQRNTTVGDYYFLKVKWHPKFAVAHCWHSSQLDMTNITLSSSANLVSGSSSSNASALDGALQAAKQKLGMKDYYTVYLRNYCAWNGNDLYAYCSPPQADFYFDPIKVWNLNSSTTGYDVNSILPQSYRNGLATYKKLSAAMFWTYTLGLASVAITILVGISAIFSRWGSFVTSFFAGISVLMVVVASAISSAMFPILKAALKKAFDDQYGTKTTLGSKVYILTWVLCAFIISSGLFWILSICCCSGRSPYNPGSKDARKTRAEKTPYTYERVGSPYLGPRDNQAVPLNTLPAQGHTGYSSGPRAERDITTAYEPFKPQHV